MTPLPCGHGMMTRKGTSRNSPLHPSKLSLRRVNPLKGLGHRDEPFRMERSGKHSKCAVFYERRSGGNRWYRSRADQPALFTILDQLLRVYTRHETYNYLGHKFNIAGEWSQQVTDMADQFMTRLDLIDASPLPVTLKVQAIRDIAFSKIQHFLQMSIFHKKCCVKWTTKP